MENFDNTVINPKEMIEDFAANPLMEKAQRALLQQLKTAEQNLIDTIREKSEEIKEKNQEHQFIGVQLYQLQQKIAKTQTSLESAVDSSQSLLDLRLQDEEVIRNENGILNQFENMNDNFKKQHRIYSTELASQNETIQKMAAYLKDFKDEIKITRKAAMKRETLIQQTESKKEDQDKYLDGLVSESRRLESELANANKRLAQRDGDIQETDIVRKEIEEELNMIIAEKKQLMMKWRSTLTGISKRDDALIQIRATLSSAENAVNDTRVAMDTLRRDTVVEQKNNELLIGLRDRLENELKWVEENISKTTTELDQFRERRALMSKSLSKTDEEEKKFNLQTKQLSLQLESTLQSLQLVIKERQTLEDELQTIQSNQSNLKRTVLNLSKDKERSLELVHTKENEIYNLENELAKSKIEALKLKVVVNQLEETISGQVNDLKEKEAMLTKYSNEIKLKNDDIEKKMYRVDRLNKKYERMVELAGGEENLGHLENNIKGMESAIQSLSNECATIERTWLTKQTEMVAVVNDIEKNETKKIELNSRIHVITQQKVRFESNLAQIEYDMKAAEHQNLDLRKETMKLSSLSSCGVEQEEQLKSVLFSLENSSYDEIKRMKDECREIQSVIAQTKIAKSSVVEEINEIDRQILLWEKKIQLEKEMKDALNPLLGQDDIVNMEKEIHRMELRLENITKQQQTLSTEIETAVLKRDSITTKYKAANAKVTTRSQASISKSVFNLQREQELMESQIEANRDKAAQCREEVQELTSQINDFNSKLLESETICSQLRSRIGVYNCKKQLALEKSLYTQKFLDKLRVYEQDTKLTCKKAEVKFSSASRSIQSVKQIITGLKDNHGHLSDLLTRIEDMANLDYLSAQ